MNIETIRKFCLSLPHVTEDIQWEDDLLFRVGRKIFAAIELDLSKPHLLSFKCTPEKFAELIEIEDIVPAPYTARYHWVSLQRLDVLTVSELKELIRNSYNMVLEKLPKKVKAELEQSKAE